MSIFSQKTSDHRFAEIIAHQGMIMNGIAVLLTLNDKSEPVKKLADSLSRRADEIAKSLLHDK